MPPSKPLIVGFAGKAEHGKTVAARISMEACARWGLKGQIFEISELIRLHCVKLSLLPPFKPRALFNADEIKVLVDEGSRMRDTVDKNYWTNECMKWVAESTCDFAAIPNVRFPQEGQGIRDRGGYVVRINRVNQDGSSFVSTTRDPNHTTETALDFWAADFYITNVTGRGKLFEGFVNAAFDYLVDEERSRLF